MQLVSYFNQFMNDEVNLNQSRVNILDQKFNTLNQFIQKTDTFCDSYQEMFSQGSYRHKTIIKPPKANKEFDADILLLVTPIDKFEDNPCEYINQLFKEFQETSTYQNIIKKNTRCVTLNYAGDFHIDIVPLIERAGGYYIVNCKDNTFELTSPIEYTTWLADKNRLTNYNLRKVIRLFKYMRDIKQNFTVKSVLLNTLLANQVYSSDSTTNYSNLPTAFKTLINRLNDYLQVNPVMPHVYNPIMPQEDFMRNWTEDQYSNFRNKIKLYNDKTNEAYNEEDKKKSIEKWKAVFGYKFPEFTRSAKLEKFNENYSEVEEFIEDKVVLMSLDYQLKINCIVKGQNGIRDMFLSVVPILRAQKKLEFFIEKIDDEIPTGYEIYWKVKNEGLESKKAGQLRGSIFKGERTHTEPTKFKGKHFVECYIVKNNVCIAMDRIDVPIEVEQK